MAVAENRLIALLPRRDQVRLRAIGETVRSDLQRRGYIRYHRGEITVLNRAGLSAAACSCHAADRAAYTRLLS